MSVQSHQTQGEAHGALTAISGRSPLGWLRSALARRVPFWRAIGEMLALTFGVTLLFYPFHQLVSSPWTELLSIASLGLYGFAAWKLEPGRGSIWRRAGRVLLWLLIFGLLSGLLSYALLTYLPWRSELFGNTIDTASIGLPLSLLNVGVTIASLFAPVRLGLSLWAMSRQRLRWQLTFSYLLIGTLTNLFAPLALFAYLGILSLAAVPTMFPPADLAPALAQAMTPTLRAGAAPADLAATLDGLLDGRTRLPLPADEQVSEFSNLGENGVRRLTLLGPEGQVLASAGAGAFAPAAPLPAEAAANLRLLLDTVAAEGVCRDGNPAGGTLVDTAVCPILDENGRILAMVVVESNLDGSAQLGAAFGRLIRVTLLGLSITLPTVILVVLILTPVALGGGYLLARRLTRRIERLTAATAGVAAGDLSPRVLDPSRDEIGQLSENFNTMAAQLSERQRALEDAATRSETLLRANKRLVADVSHELRNPLATLQGYVEALELEHGAQLPADDLRVIKGELGRLTALVDDLFTLARAEAQQLPLTLGPVDTLALVQGLADAIAPLARRERQIEIVVQLDPATPHAFADAARLEQVVRNLAQNALRYTPPGGIIAFELAPGPERTVSIAVADTGVGIEAVDLPHVFERFYRSDSSRARETGGAGLGLSLVRELVTAMGGTVAVESTPGRGSRFVVTLPAA